MKRFFDIFFSLLGLMLISPLLLIFMLLIYFHDKGSPIYITERVGKNKKIFSMIKLRSMYINSDKNGVSSTSNNDSRITKVGHVIRKYKFDEFTQLWNVLIGNMSLVGPRPCLLNQKRLINERKKRGVFNVKPGITGLAQVSNITMKTPTLLSKTDLKMIKQMNLYYYFYYILKTFL